MNGPEARWIAELRKELFGDLHARIVALELDVVSLTAALACTNSRLQRLDDSMRSQHADDVDALVGLALKLDAHEKRIKTLEEEAMLK